MCWCSHPQSEEQCHHLSDNANNNSFSFTGCLENIEIPPLKKNSKGRDYHRIFILAKPRIHFLLKFIWISLGYFVPYQHSVATKTGAPIEALEVKLNVLPRKYDRPMDWWINGQKLDRPSYRKVSLVLSTTGCSSNNVFPS